MFTIKMVNKVILTLMLFSELAYAGRFIPAKDSIKDKYIVLLTEKSTNATLEKLINDYKGEQKGVTTFVFGDFIGYSAEFNEHFKNRILNDSRVAYVEQDALLKVSQDFTCSQFQPMTEYFLKRVSQTSNPEPDFYRYEAKAGEGVNAYILDTGIYFAHNEFTGRAERGRSFIPGETVDDSQGHGTCMASILAGTQFGAAKKAVVIAVKVANNEGNAPINSIIGGLSWVFFDKRPGKKIILLPLTKFFSVSLNNAVRSMRTLKIPIIVPAGNQGHKAELFSPSSESSAITVAASNKDNSIRSSSNYGSFIDIIAPGEAIKCAAIHDPNAFIYDSGTSHAAALTAGVAAVVLSSTEITSGKDLSSQLILMSRKNMVTGLTGERASTPNRLLYNGCKQ